MIYTNTKIHHLFIKAVKIDLSYYFVLNFMLCESAIVKQYPGINSYLLERHLRVHLYIYLAQCYSAPSHLLSSLQSSYNTVIFQLMSQHAHILTGMVTVSNLNVLVEKVINLTTRLQTLFLGLSNNDLSLVKQTELKALTFRLASTLVNSQELATQMKAQDVYINYLTALQR